MSLCIPTNGVVEWVFPVLESIFNQGIDDNCFEVVITDNGANSEFKCKIKDYLKKHENIIYAETNALPFINEIEAYKRSNGEMIKFVNHRTLLLDGTLERLINYSKNNYNEKPITYFSNGVLKLGKGTFHYSSFDLFVRNLSYWSSWSTGMAIWRDDFERILSQAPEYNELFPHTTILFNERDRSSYCIDNTVIFSELPQGRKPKGDYDLFHAFGIEYPWIISTLYRDGSISIDTLREVLDNNLEFIASLYVSYSIKKEYSSYDLSGLNNIFGIYYRKNELYRRVIKRLMANLHSKIWR